MNAKRELMLNFGPRPKSYYQTNHPDQSLVSDLTQSQQSGMKPNDHQKSEMWNEASNRGAEKQLSTGEQLELFPYIKPSGSLHSNTKSIHMNNKLADVMRTNAITYN